MRLGAAYGFSMDMGSLTTPSQLEAVGSHVDDAVAMANAAPYGLPASVWGRNGAEVRKVAGRLHARTVNVDVNEAFAAARGSIGAPWAAWATRASAVVTAPTGCSSTPEPRPSPTGDSRASPRPAR